MPPARVITSAALLVCTYRRPLTFASLIRSVAALELPSHLAFEIVVADNNPASAWESYIQPAVAPLPWPVHYGHEPEAGYSNARNKAIEVALASTRAEILLFVDDDMVLDPRWLAEHLRSHVELGADVVNGRIHGVRERFAHASVLEKCGAGNVSFHRRLVDAEPAGLGLRFDPAFNKTGSEDQAFFRAATAKGVVIRQSDFPRIFNYYGETTTPEAEVINKMHTTAAMHQNDVARVRRERGVVPAAAMASKGLLYAFKAATATIERGFWLALRKPQQARASELSAQKELLKMKGRFAGLSGRMIDRQDVRRSDPTE